ncbi:MAG: hypothetical protein ACRDD7_01715 [Peptostreptococcaceae bacterium]
MKKSEVLACGTGGCGNNLLDEFMGLDRRYAGIFMNTNLAEMTNKKHYDKDRRSFFVANADGTGKDRSVCETYVKEDAPRFVDMVKKYINQSLVVYFTSGNGGTGSKASLLLAQLTKKMCPEKTISLMGTMPNIGESDIDFRNAIDFWNELIIAKKKGFIDNITLIDNNKKLSESDINKKAMKCLNASFDMAKGKLDSSDISRYHKAKGYNVPLILDTSYRDTNDCINHTINNSIFFVPTNEDGNIECDVLVANINKNDFNVDVVKKRFIAYEFVKINEVEEGESVILVGGADMPKEAIELAQEALKEIQKRKSLRNKNDDLMVDMNDMGTNSTMNNQQKSKTKNDEPDFTSEDLNDLFADDSFWD